MEKRQIEEFQITIPRPPVERYLGIPAGARPRRSTADLLDEALESGASLVNARAVMRYSESGLDGSAHVPRDVPLVAVVCTIGPRLEQRVAELSAAGESARAAVLDAVGSAAAEETADASNRLICQLAAPTDLRPRPRRSPGYGSWRLDEQRALFEFLAPEDIGVRLNDACMMLPRKSVSYVVRLDAYPGEAESVDRCSVCPATDCPFRQVGGHTTDSTLGSG